VPEFSIVQLFVNDEPLQYRVPSGIDSPTRRALSGASGGKVGEKPVPWPAVPDVPGAEPGVNANVGSGGGVAVGGSVAVGEGVSSAFCVVSA